jgi:hypothetical protein
MIAPVRETDPKQAQLQRRLRKARQLVASTLLGLPEPLPWAKRKTFSRLAWAFVLVGTLATLATLATAAAIALTAIRLGD